MATLPSVELLVRLSDGSFEAKLSVPLDAPPVVREQAVTTWLDAMRQVLSFQISIETREKTS